MKTRVAGGQGKGHVALALAVVVGAVSAGAAPGEPAPAREPDVIFVPTPDTTVAGMLELAGVGAGDVVYDLGSGDGRIPIAAARLYGARGVGVELDPRRIAEARDNARQAGVEDRVTFIEGDLFETDVSGASVVTLYLLPELNRKLLPKLLAELRPGTRIVSHAFDMGDWQPEETRNVGGTTIYLWRVPERP